ncbi:glycosyltransferase family 2 protein [Mucilaginibacter sp.]|uniref:glycosyltransferase family 2 protein n=1 Tax=Mucilaginibacter sp. TaxID=1882438 RepID=UPI003AFF81A5
MQRIPATPPEIAPLGSLDERPFWSVMIPAYNCSVFLPDAIESVLAQDPGEAMMQIEVVDDCSMDEDVEALVKRLGKGRVLYYRQEKNVGSLRNFETCINRAKGYHIHLLHGDDRVKSGFYSSLKRLFDNFPDAGAAYCAWNYIDDQGNILRPSRIEAEAECVIDNCLSLLAEQQLLQYVCIAVKREVYEKLGSFYGVTYGEDWIMWARIAKEYPIAYLPKILAEYREHESSISNTSFISGKNIRDISKVFSIINSYLPKEKQKKASLAARKTYCYWALGVTCDIWHTTRNKEIVYNQLREIVKLYKDPKVLKITAGLLFLMQVEPFSKYLKRIINFNPKNEQNNTGQN